MDNMRMDCSYLVRSPSADSECLTLRRVNFKCKSWVFFLEGGIGFFFPLHLSLAHSKVWEFLLHYLYMYDLQANGGASSLSISDQCDHPWMAGTPKVLKSSKWRAEGSAGFCISHLLYGFKKAGERGQLIMHMIWGYIQSLDFKLLDERQLWINVIFSLTHGHLLRARKKVFVCTSTINIPYYCSWRFTVLLKHPRRLSKATDFRYLFAETVSSPIQIMQNSPSFPRINWEKLRPRRRGTCLLSKGKHEETRADCQRTERHSSVNLFKVCLVDVLLLWWGTYVHSSCATINRQWLCAS